MGADLRHGYWKKIRKAVWRIRRSRWWLFTWLNWKLRSHLWNGLGATDTCKFSKVRKQQEQLFPCGFKSCTRHKDAAKHQCKQGSTTSTLGQVEFILCPSQCMEELGAFATPLLQMELPNTSSNLTILSSHPCLLYLLLACWRHTHPCCVWDTTMRPTFLIKLIMETHCHVFRNHGSRQKQPQNVPSASRDYIRERKSSNQNNQHKTPRNQVIQTVNGKSTFMQTDTKTPHGLQKAMKEPKRRCRLLWTLFFFFKLIFFPSGFKHSFTNTQGTGYTSPYLTRGWSKVREGSCPTSIGLSLENQAWPCRNCYNSLILWCHTVSKYIPVNAKGKRRNLWNIHSRKLLWERVKISTQQRAEPSFCFSLFDEKSFCSKAPHLPRPSTKGCKVRRLTRLKQLITAQRVREGRSERCVFRRSTQTQGNERKGVK